MSDRRLVLLVLFAVAMWVGIESPGISAVEPPVGGSNLIRNGEGLTSFAMVPLNAISRAGC